MIELTVGMGEISIGYEDSLLVSLGLGSCVGVALYDPHNKIAGLAHIMLPASSELNKSLPDKKIMIAEKDIITKNHLKSILVNYGFEIVCETKERYETLNSYRQLKPSVSFISAFLPPTNAMDVIHALMSIDNNMNAIIISPRVERNVIVEYLSSGAQEVIQKPFNAQNVLSSVDYVLYKNVLKCADKAIPIMLGRMINRGAKKYNIIAKIAGGAHMFTSIMSQETMNIGKRNVAAVKSKLDELGIRIMAEETGSNIGRTIKFNVSNGILLIKTKDTIKEI